MIFVLLALAGFVGAAMNAVAGGGSFVTFPAMVAAGLPSVAANASSTVSLVPGSFASTLALRGDLAAPNGASLKGLLAVSLVGGLAGALLLLATPAAAFDRVVPWLLLLAFLALAFGGRFARGREPAPRWVPLAAQVPLAIYGGYFGGALGLMSMAAWTVMGNADLKAMNPMKVLLTGTTNLAAVGCFAFSGQVHWAETGAMLLGAVLGGTVGARLARRLPSGAVRWATLAVTGFTTAAFFVRAYG